MRRVARLGSRILAVLSMLSVSLAVTSAPSVAFEGYGLAGQFGGEGKAAGQFMLPGGVAVDEASGEVYVVDSATNRVERFGGAGESPTEFNGDETPAGSFSSPWGIAVDNALGPDQGDVYVADVGNSVVDVFDASGKYLTQIAGTPGGSFSSLEGVAIGAGGQLWVYDEEHLDQFSTAGVYVSQFNTERGAERGLAVDAHNDVFLLFGSSGGEYDEGGEQLAEWEVAQQPGEELIDTALAIDPITNEVFADEGSWLEADGPFGASLTEPTAIFGAANLRQSAGIAVNGSNGLVYASSDATDKVYIFRDALFPDVSTGVASDLGQTSTTVGGSVNPDGMATTYHVEYGTTTAYGSSTAPQSAGEGETELPVSADISGLEFGETYHYRLVAENKNGANFGADRTLTTLPNLPLIEQPGVANDITRDAATLSAAIDPEKGVTSSYFEYGTTPAYGLSTPSAQSAGFGESAVSVVAGELIPLTTYHFRLVSTNLAGTVRGADETFTTGQPVLPVVATGQPSGVSQTSATLTGTIARSEEPLTYAFEVGTAPDALGAPTGLGSVGVGAGNATAMLEVTGLQPGSTCYYRIDATNADGTSYGSVQSFTTLTFPGTQLAPPAMLPLLATPTIAFPGEPDPPAKAKLKPKHRPKKHKRTVKHKKSKRNRAGRAKKR